jgi:hypothetical protein
LTPSTARFRGIAASSLAHQLLPSSRGFTARNLGASSPPPQVTRLVIAIGGRKHQLDTAL